VVVITVVVAVRVMEMPLIEALTVSQSSFSRVERTRAAIRSTPSPRRPGAGRALLWVFYDRDGENRHRYVTGE